MGSKLILGTVIVFLVWRFFIVAFSGLDQGTTTIRDCDLSDAVFTACSAARTDILDILLGTIPGADPQLNTILVAVQLAIIIIEFLYFFRGVS